MQLKVQVELGLEDSEVHYPWTEQEEMEEVRMKALLPPVPVVEAQELEVEPQVLEGVQGMELVEGRSVQEC